MAKKSAADEMQDKLYNLQAQQLAAQVANWAAQLEFQKTRFQLLELPQFQQGMQLEVDKLAWEKAQDTWERAYQEAAITGMYQGQPTTQWLMDQARLTGSYNGERTLEGKLTDAQIQDMNDKMKLANDQFLVATTGYMNGQKTFDREKFEAAQALEGWKFIATLSGPQNAFKQLRAIASTPGGVGQMMQGFAGQYMLPGSSAIGIGGAGGANPAGQLNDMLGMGGAGGGAGGYYPVSGAAGTGGGGVSTGNPYGAGFQPIQVPNLPTVNQEFAPFYGVPGAGQHPNTWDAATQQAVAQWEAANPGYKADGTARGFYVTGTTPQAFGMPTTTAPQYYQPQAGYTYSPAGAQAPVNTWNYSGTDSGNVQVYPPGVASPAQTPDVSSNVPMTPASAAPLVSTPYQYGGPGVYAPAQSANAMLMPNQINAENYENSYDYQKQILWAGYEDAGIDKGLAQESYLKSLPKYGGVSKGSVAF
jgi:hypothetical protein